DVCSSDLRRARRRLLQLDPQGGELVGQGRRLRRADGVRGGDPRPAASGRLRLSRRRLEAAPEARAGQDVRADLMVDSIINCASPEDADAVLIGVPYEHGASFGAGAARGPAAIVACLDRQIEFFERHTGTEPSQRYAIALRMLEDVGALPPERMVERVAEAVLRCDAFVVLLGGIHSVSIGALRAHARRSPADDVTVVQIDAHLDMRDDDSDYNDRNPSRFAHSCVMRRAREMGFRTCSIGARAYAL